MLLTRVRRLIPAHAGKTSSPFVRQAVPRAHPRSRGENSAPGCGRRYRRGSSPLTRGKRARSPLLVVPPRLIPAHAGKTHCKDSYPWCAAAHPRSRGENGTHARGPLSVEGSSPLTRGKPYQIGRGPSVTRLIPAHAGKTTCITSWVCLCWAHPRSRGENCCHSVNWKLRDGSSPLTRGKHGGRRPDRTARRLIPAHAGKTTRSCLA